VSTYPPVTDRERDAALARIARRHHLREDTRWSAAGLDEHAPARDVLNYLRQRNQPGHIPLPAGLAADDIWDELVLAAWVYWDERRHERERLHRARRYGLSYAELGRYLGIGTRQGMRDYLDRLDASIDEYTRINHTRHGPATGDGATDPLARIAGTTRAARGADVHAARATRAHHKARPGLTDWITTHQPQITSAITELLTHTARAGIQPEPSDADAEPGLGDYLSWLTEDLAEQHNGHRIAPDTIATLGLALAELNTHPTLDTLPLNHGLRLAIKTAHQLRATYAQAAGGT
jgi:hypothetical protein